MSEGWEDLKGSKYDWLINLGNLGRKRQRGFKLLRESALKTARAWAIKDLAMRLWGYVSRTWAEKRWKQWLSWAFRSQLEPVRKVARTIKEHLWGMLNAIILEWPTMAHPRASTVESRRSKYAEVLIDHPESDKPSHFLLPDVASHYLSLPLNGGRGFPGNIIRHAANAGDLVDNTIG